MHPKALALALHPVWMVVARTFEPLDGLDLAEAHPAPGANRV